jgi:hypothetical protein
MAVILEANYSKKIGLPAYSSHSFSVTIRTEIADVSDVQRSSAQLCSLLQESVDRSIQDIGFCPDGNGSSPTPRTTNGQAAQPGTNDQWACPIKQRDLILKIVEEHKLNKQDVEALAKDIFNLPVSR